MKIRAESPEVALAARVELCGSDGEAEVDRQPLGTSRRRDVSGRAIVARRRSVHRSRPEVDEAMRSNDGLAAR
jgi:hypothetical protein